MALPPGMRPVKNPPNPWLSTEVEYLAELGEPPVARLEIIEDATKSILSENDSPDLGFRWSVNPYRGCWHGCNFCYARPRHELLSFGAGTDFERKLVVKPDAPALLREAFDKPSWKGELLMLSGDTDCYQPLEASYRLTRGLLEVCAEYKNPCAVISKAPLVERDIDLFVELTRVADFGITISIPLWNPEHSRAMEPFVATPQRRIKTIARLAAAGLRVSVNIAPMIPGLGDEDMPTILEAAHDAGATRAGFTFLRLPGPVAGIFADRIEQLIPLRADRVLNRVRAARGGKLYDPRFGARMRGQGPYAEAAAALFEATTKRLGFETSGGGPRAPKRDTFQRPDRSPQLKLF